LNYDAREYEAAAQSHSKISGSAVGEYQKREFAGLETEFVGYNSTQSEAKIVAIRDNKIVLDRSPFYAESGGQSGDSGELWATRAAHAFSTPKKKARPGFTSRKSKAI
jgi:alanyl-tRNA synthetase